MGEVRLDPSGAVTASAVEALIGITDLHVVRGAGGPVLVSTTRGGGWVTTFDLSSGGAASELDRWRIDDSRLQLESTDLATVTVSGTEHLLLAGLAGSALTALRLNDGNLSGVSSFGAFGQDMSDLRALATDGSFGLAALRSGGLSVVDFSSLGMSMQPVTGGDPVNGALASAVAVLDTGGARYGFAAFGRDDALSAFRITGTQATALATVTTDTVGGALAGPEALRAVEIGGEIYAIAAASGTGSLSVFHLAADGVLSLVDQVLDSRDTRFADAAHLEVLTVDGRVFVAAAGSDRGISLFTLMPGGRLHHLDTIAATMDTRLRGVTDITMAEMGGDLHVWAATQAAPYLVQFTATGLEIGQTRAAGDTGETMIGSGADDVLVGGAGDDVITGNAGRDVLVDGAGSDQMTGGAGADTFVLTYDGEDDTILDFQVGQDRVDLSFLPGIWDPQDVQVLSWSWGAELRYRGEVTYLRTADGTRIEAADIFDTGLTRIDRVTLSEASGQILGTLSPDDFLGTDEGESFDGQPGEDRLFGEAGNDTLMGSGGDDYLSGGFHEDLLYGGNGNDTITGDAGLDTIFGGDGGDFLNGGGQADVIYGGAGNDRILGEDGYDLLYGESGNDTLIGGDTADRLYGGTGDDSLSGGINFGQTVDGLFGEDGNDTLRGDGGFDFLDGGAGNDSLDGGAQADNLYGRAGHDTLEGGDGLDRLFGGTGDDLLFGGAGNDGLFGQEGNDTLTGGSGDDRFFAGVGDDLLFGEAGNDSLHGGAGFDTLIGGAGNDSLRGDFNADLFVFSDGHGIDQISDFEALNDFERLDLAGISAITDLADLLDNHIAQQGAHVVIDTAGGQITLLDTLLSDLGANDFIF